MSIHIIYLRIHRRYCDVRGLWKDVRKFFNAVRAKRIVIDDDAKIVNGYVLGERSNSHIVVTVFIIYNLIP